MSIESFSAEPIPQNFSDSAAMKVREGQSQMVLTTKNGKIVDQSITQVHNSINLNLKVFVHPLENGNPFTFYGRPTSRQSEMQKGSSTLRISTSWARLTSGPKILM